MKKILIITAVILAVLLGTLVSVPFLFKDALLRKTKSTISQNLNVTVNFDGFHLSLIRSFPKASLSLKNVLITGKNEFARDTLLQIASLRTSCRLFDLFSPDNLTISELIIDHARLNLLVNKANKSNWNIFPETTGPAKPAGKNNFKLELDKIAINHSSLMYKDQTLPMNIDCRDINMALKGRMFGDNTELKVQGTSGQFDLSYDSVNYISKIRLEVKSLLKINFNSLNFIFDEGELLVNGLPVDVGGSFSMPNDSMLFDLRFASKVSELNEFLTLVPPDYESYMKNLKAAGKAELSGFFKGLYYKETYPALNILFKISGGNLHYTGFSEEIKNITADLSVKKPEGSFNLTSVNISKAHAEIRNNPLDFSLQIINLMEDMHFNGELVGKVNFDQLKDAIPLDSMQISGLLNVNLGVNGNMSAIESKNYGLVKTSGILSLSGFSFSGKQLSMPVTISSGIMDFTPEKVNLQQLRMNIGQSDMTLTGSVSDYYAYLLDRGTLSGNVKLTSDYLNINELMALQKPGDTQNSANNKASGKMGKDTISTAASNFSVPERIHLSFQTDIKKALYDKLKITNINGQVMADNGRLDLNGLKMNVLDGQVNIAGVYQNTPQNSPLVNLSVDLLSFSIPTAYQSLKLFRNYVPIAAQSKGRFSTSIKINGRLDKNMNLIMENLNGSGIFHSYGIEILNSPVFNKIKTILKEEKLNDVKIDDFTAQFTIENGNLLLNPFKTRIADQEATFTGRLNANDLMDMDISFIINREALSENLQNTLGFLPGQRNIRTIPVDVTVKGPVKNPDVKVNLTEARKAVLKEVRNASKEDIQKTINKVGQGLKKLFQ